MADRGDHGVGAVPAIVDAFVADGDRVDVVQTSCVYDGLDLGLDLCDVVEASKELDALGSSCVVDGRGLVAIRTVNADEGVATSILEVAVDLVLCLARAVAVVR